MEHQRPHLDRAAGDVEVGVYNATADRSVTAKHAAPHAQAPAFLRNWEKRRPIWLVELLAETLGVFVYTFCGVGATAALVTTHAATMGTTNLTQFGSSLSVSVAYGLGVVFAIALAGPVSGGHLSPGFTIAFALYKGFPLRKVPQYIVAQILGGFLAVLCVYGQYKQNLDLVYLGIEAAVTAAVSAAAPAGAPAAALAPVIAAHVDAVNYSPFGPAGVLALFVSEGTILRYVFLNELIANIVLAIIVFTAIDPTNAFISITTGPWMIGAAYLAIIVAFSGATAILNTARDLGGRFACACIYGSGAFNYNKSFTALAALTNILGTLIGGAIQTFWLSDHRRPQITAFPGNAQTHAMNTMYDDPVAREPPIVNGNGNASSTAFEEKGDRFASQNTVGHREYIN